MELNQATKLKDILDTYPQIKERLPEIDPKFKMLQGPLGKVMPGKTTIADMSKKSGIRACKDAVFGI